MFKKLAVAAAAALPLAASAALFTFANEFSGGADCANMVTGCATLEVTASGSNTHFKLTGTMAPGEFITSLYGNIDPFKQTFATSFSGTGLNAAQVLSISQDAYKADGDGYFDWRLDLSSSPPRFDGVDTLEWVFLDTTLADAIGGISQNGPAGKTGFSFALHAQGLEGGSGWFNGVLRQPEGDPDPQDLPEPSTLYLALAVLGFALAQHKNKSQA